MSKSFYNNKSLNDRNKQNIIQLMDTILKNNSELLLTEDQLDSFVNEIIEEFGEKIANTMPKEQQQIEIANEGEEQEYDKDKIVAYVKEKLLVPVKLKEQEEQRQKEEQEHLSEQGKIQFNFKKKLEQECVKLQVNVADNNPFTAIYNDIQDFLQKYNFKKKKDKKRPIKLDSKAALEQLVKTQNDNKTLQIVKFYQKVCKKDINKFQESLLNKVKRLFNDYDITQKVVEEEQKQTEQDVEEQEQQKQYTFLTNDLVCDVLNIIGEQVKEFKNLNVNMLLEKAQTLKDIVNKVLPFATPVKHAYLSQYEQQLNELLKNELLELQIELEEKQYRDTPVKSSNEQKIISMLYKKREEDAEIKKVKEKYPILYKNINTKEKLDEFNKNFEQPINPFVEPTKTDYNVIPKSFNVFQSEDDNVDNVKENYITSYSYNKQENQEQDENDNKPENQQQDENNDMETKRKKFENKIDITLQKIHKQVETSVKDYQKGLDNKIEELKNKINKNLSSFEKIKDTLNKEELKDIDYITKLFNNKNTLFENKELKTEEYIEN